ADLQCRLWLVIARANAHSVWRDDAEQWAHQFTGLPTGVYIMDDGPHARQNRWNKFQRFSNIVQIVVVEPEIFLRDFVTRTKKEGQKRKVFQLNPNIKFKPDIIIVDDYHKRFRSHNSDSLQALRMYMSHSRIPNFFALTGTPGNRPKDFWTML